MKNNERANDDIRNYLNIKRLWTRASKCMLILSPIFDGQQAFEDVPPLRKPVLPPLVVAKYEGNALRPIQANAAKDYGLPKLDEGIFDPTPLGRPIEWWIERRFGEPIISFKLDASPGELYRLYGSSILELIGSNQAVQLIVENYVSDRWSRIREPLFDALPEEEPRPLVMIMQHRLDDGIGAPPTEIVATPTVPNDWPDPDFHVIDEEIDAENSPLRRPVYWRLELRGSEKIYCTRFQGTQKEAVRLFGDGSLPYIQGSQSIQFALENYPSDSWRSIRTPIGPSKTSGLSDAFLDYVRRGPWNRNECGF